LRNIEELLKKNLTYRELGYNDLADFKAAAYKGKLTLSEVNNYFEKLTKNVSELLVKNGKCSVEMAREINRDRLKNLDG